MAATNGTFGAIFEAKLLRELPQPESNPGQDSQVDDDVTNRLRAANQKVAIGGLLEWLGPIGNITRNQTALAVVTNTGPARPTDRDVARLGQLQNALVG